MMAKTIGYVEGKNKEQTKETKPPRKNNRT
jgi:hypothetical protein